MERKATFKEIRELFGDSFFSPEKVKGVSPRLRLIDLEQESGGMPAMPFELSFLRERKDTHYLFPCVSLHSDKSPVTILSLRAIFGTNPLQSEPCFYNQDWYMKERFVTQPLRAGWYLFSKNLINSSRGKSVNEISVMHEISGNFPSAVLCTYFFFLSYLIFNKPVMESDYIWNSDLDANGDRIYVGKYIDPLGVNKNGWEIHRHLSLKPNYGALQVLER